MAKDERLAIIRDLIKIGRIEIFADIFKYVPTSVFARELGWNQIRVSGYRENVGTIRLDDVFKIAELLNIEVDDLTQILIKQIKRQRMQNKDENNTGDTAWQTFEL